MSEQNPVLNRTRFNFQDVLVLIVALAAIVGVFVWAFLSFNRSTGGIDSALFIRYGNSVVAEKLPIYDQEGQQLTYSLSFRRDIKKNESYKDDTYKKYIEVELESLNLEASRLNDMDSEMLNGRYFIIEDSIKAFEGFMGLYGPQLDILVNDGGFRVSYEESPDHVCSNQGFTDFINYPVVCLPNSMYFWLVSDSYRGPDA